MLKDNESIKDLREKTLKGLDLSFERLLISKAKKDEDLVISVNGEIVKVKARDLIEKQ